MKRFSRVFALGLLLGLNLPIAEANSIDDTFVASAPEYFPIFKFVGNPGMTAMARSDAAKYRDSDVSSQAVHDRLYFQIVNRPKPADLDQTGKRDVLELFAQMELPKVFRELPMSVPQALALYNYGTDSYKVINPLLRTDSPSPSILAYKAELNSALDQLPPFRGVVKRGTDLPQAIVDTYKVGNQIEFTSFTSATADLSLGVYESTYRFIIRSETGRDISSLTPYPYEKEILFKAGSRFKIIRATPDVINSGVKAKIEFEIVELAN